MAAGHGSVYKPSCSCMLCCLLSSSTPNAWVMAYLCSIIRQAHTYTMTGKSHLTKTDKQGWQTQWHSCSHYSQEEVLGGWWVAKNGERKYYISSEVATSEGPACVTNSVAPLIQLMAGWALWSHFMRFKCSLLSSAPISNFNHDILFVGFISLCWSFWFCSDR